jgi:YD repeat-containing protein
MMRNDKATEMDRLIKETGFDGRIQSYRYDAAGQLIARHLPATDKDVG